MRDVGPVGIFHFRLYENSSLDKTGLVGGMVATKDLKLEELLTRLFVDD